MYDFKSRILSIPDYPKEGVVFRDITTLLADAEAFREAIGEVAKHFAGRGVTKVIGTEARGFMVGAPVAIELGCGFVPARKPGKLPRETLSQEYELEYGTDALEMHADALSADDVAIVVDDLVATGGTAAASARLAETAGAKVAGFGFLLELTSFNPRERLAMFPDADFFSLVQYD